MININQAYQFFLTFPDGEVQVYPEIDRLDWKDNFNEDQKFYTREIDSELVFTNNTHATFTALTALEENNTSCYKVVLKVKYRKSNGTYELCYTGYLPFRKGKYDYSRAQVEIKPVSEDGMRCVLNDWKKKKNLFNVTQRIGVSTLKGEIEQSIKIAYEHIPDPPTGYGWVILKTEKEVVYEDSQYTADPLYTQYTVTYVREYTTDVQTGSEWVLIGSTYYRKPPISATVVTNSITTGGGGSVELIYDVTITQSKIIDISVDNGLTLKSALEYLASDCSLAVKSNFLNINPVSEEIYATEYTFAAVDFENVAIFQASDVIRPDADTNATIFNASFEDLLGDLITKLDLYVFYDTTNTCLRIEHESYRTRRRMLNLEQAQFLADLKGRRSYEYLSNDFPLKETFKDAYDDSIDFSDATIEYDPTCSSSIRGEQDRTIRTERTIYDLGAIWNNEELIDDKDIRTAIVMVAMDSDNKVITDKGNISDAQVLNSPFAWANVLTRYHLRNRPLLSAIINGEEVDFLQTKPIRKQEDITVNISREDYFTSFNPDDLVKTQFGWGEPKEPTFTEPTQELELEVNFRLKR